jgi:two-component system nitrogen regulation response regulator NtrX
MSLKTQAKVLRVLQEQVMEPVGGSTRVRVDTRVLAATNKDLPDEIRAGRFREDLFFRLNVVPISVPPLRDRRSDIPLLADHFMALLAREYGRRAKVFDRDAMVVLGEYAWPGNVRELRNVVERLMIMVPGDRVTGREVAFLDPLRAAPGANGDEGGQPTGTLHAARDAFERGYILKALAAQHGNVSRTADALGIERSNLYRKMRGFGIMLPRRSEEEDAS